MRVASLRHALERALLLGAPLSALGCVTTISCPDDGSGPPNVSMHAIEPGYAAGAPLSALQCEEVCELGWGVITCVRTEASMVLCVTPVPPCEGRRPAGLTEGPRAAGSGIEHQLAEMARLEAASVEAFRVLRRELAAHGAPRRLLRAASRAARDERRHARIVTALARRFAASPAPPTVEPRELRELEEIAVENAIEGCVRETWGALIALRQAELAEDLDVRAAMQRIARDELRHAALAWDVHAWIAPRLPAAARRRAANARSAAVTQLARELQFELPQAARHRLGLPCAAEALTELAELDRTLWATAS